MALETTFVPLTVEELPALAAAKKDGGWRFVQLLAVNTEDGIDLIYSFMKDNLLENHEIIRVATKYPNIAKDYFYNTKHQTVEIIKLNGSIELAPIVGLSEVIVDIVETGSTLRENGLKVLEEVCPLSARMVVNQVSMKMEDERIRKLITELRNVVK